MYFTAFRYTTIYNNAQGFDMFYITIGQQTRVVVLTMLTDSELQYGLLLLL